MRAQPNRLEDKRLLINLSKYLSTSVERIKLDECQDWNIFGRKGSISTDSVGWYIFTTGGSKRKWASIKHKLSFMEVSQDGDEEGILKLERMPSPEEAEVIREVVGLRKRPELTEEQRGELRNRLKVASSKGVS